MSAPRPNPPTILLGRASDGIPSVEQEVTVNPAAHLEDELWDSCVRNDANEDGDGDDDDGYDDYIQQLTEAIVMMKPTRQEIVRAVPVYKVLRGAAPALRGATGDFYIWSKPAGRIEVFWSHSWHGSPWMKVLSLYFLNNATAACTVSTAAAVFAGIAFGLGWLPAVSQDRCWWCMGIGSISYVLAMVFWPSRRRVFVDRFCISQHDPELKAEGLFSLGAILKSSDAMLVLWDPSWVQRLWCVFELAAFLHTRFAHEEPPVIIRPTVLGLTLCSGWFALCLSGWSYSLAQVSGYDLVVVNLVGLSLSGLIFFAIAHLCRKYCRDVTTMCHQVANFRVAAAKSYCCASEHRIAGSQESMICDREVVQRCIGKWFGSAEAFERRVHSEVRDLLVNQLSNHMISYWRFIEATPVFLWNLLDIAAHELRLAHQGDHGMYQRSVLTCLAGLTYWFAAGPCLFRILIRLAWMMQAQRASTLMDLLASLLLLVTGIVIFGSFVFLYFVFHLYLFYVESPWGPIIWSMIVFSFALVTWRKLPNPVPRQTSALQ